MHLYKRKNSPNWWYEFQHAGQRVRGTSGCSTKREAEKIALTAQKEAKEAASLRRVMGGPAVSLRMEDAALRYSEEKKGFFSEDRNVLRDLEWLVEAVGVSKLITDIDDADVALLVAKRRESRVERKGRPLVSAGTVNHTVVRLQALLTHAKRFWKVKLPNEPYWRQHKLRVVQKDARVFEQNEKARFDGATRDDFGPILAFSYESGKRRAYCVDLRWSDVKWGRGVIERPGKRNPDGSVRLETVQLTPEIRAIIEPLKGHHEEFVFTYVAERNRDGRKRGQRYPIVASYLETRFKRICGKAKIEDFGFHSMRRSAATEFFDATGNDLLATQKFLGHGDSRTTEKYILRGKEKVRAGMESRAKLRAQPDLTQEVPTLAPHTDDAKVA